MPAVAPVGKTPIPSAGSSSSGVDLSKKKAKVDPDDDLESDEKELSSKIKDLIGQNKASDLKIDPKKHTLNH